MKRTLFDPEHEEYRASVREFIEREVTPNYDTWESERLIDRSIFAKAIESGLYGLEIPESFGGSAISDFRYRVIVTEELARSRATGLSISLSNQDDMMLYYLLDLADDQQLQRWMPAFARGELIGAVAMTEPGAGSDLRGMRTTAIRDGDGWILNGQKTFITHAISADLIVVAARTVASDGEPGYSLFAVERGTPGLERGRKLEKVGLHSQDTGELFFEDVRLPSENLIGKAGDGLRQLFSHLPRERLATSVGAIADARAIYELTEKYCFEREAFGQSIGDFQATRFALAEMSTELDVTQSYVDGQVLAYNDGELTDVEAAKGKWWASELQKRVVDRCLQLHGGYGYMLEYPVARAFVDSRVQTIYGGTTEIMKEIIGRDIAKRNKKESPMNRRSGR